LTIAFQYLSGGIVAMTCYSAVALGVLAEWSIYRVLPTYPAVLGMSIIIAAGLLTVVSSNCWRVKVSTADCILARG